MYIDQIMVLQNRQKTVQVSSELSTCKTEIVRVLYKVRNLYQKDYILACYLLINCLFVTKIHVQTQFKHIVVGPNQKIFSQPQSGHRRSHESISVRNSLIPQKPALAQIVWLSGQVLLTNLIRIALVYTTSKIHHQVTNLLTKKDVAKPKKFFVLCLCVQ